MSKGTLYFAMLSNDVFRIGLHFIRLPVGILPTFLVYLYASYSEEIGGIFFENLSPKTRGDDQYAIIRSH